MAQADQGISKAVNDRFGDLCSLSGYDSSCLSGYDSSCLLRSRRYHSGRSAGGLLPCRSSMGRVGKEGV
jgi:hypothetical protein